jgi:hypothetical protein
MEHNPPVGERRNSGAGHPLFEVAPFNALLPSGQLRGLPLRWAHAPRLALTRLRIIILGHERSVLATATNWQFRQFVTLTNANGVLAIVPASVTTGCASIRQEPVATFAAFGTFVQVFHSCNLPLSGTEQIPSQTAGALRKQCSHWL